MRPSGRAPDEMRAISFEPHFTKHAEGSVLVSFGHTKVICTASVEERVPPFLRGKGEGWVTAEYSMLPRATHTRTSRERGTVGGRTQEIQRLIGRSVRAMLDDFKWGEYTLKVDCDVLQADGGTRTAAITGAAVAVCDAFDWMVASGRLKASPVKRRVAAVSVGVVDGRPVLDLEYAEDVRAEVDANVVMASADRFVEVQGTGENNSFSRGELDALLDLAHAGIRTLDAAQARALAGG